MAGNDVIERRKAKIPKIGADGLAFGERLKKLREQRGLSTADIGSRVGISAQAIAKYENNPASEPEFFNGIAIARALNVSPWELAGERSSAEGVVDISSARNRRYAKWGDSSLDPSEINTRIPRPSTSEPGFAKSDAAFVLAATPYLSPSNIEILLRSPKMANNTLRAMQRAGELPRPLPDSTSERAILESRFDLLKQMDEMDRDLADRAREIRILVDVLDELLSDRGSGQSIRGRIEERLSGLLGARPEPEP